MPKGPNDAVESYLKDLPVNLLPIKGSPAAQERKQLLQKQIPLHDIDPSLCHALTENEVKQMNDYIAHVKQHSVGVGHILKLNELLKNRQSTKAHLLSSRAPMQIPQSQNIILQGVDRSNSLHKTNDENKTSGNLPNIYNPSAPIVNEIDYQNSTNLGGIRDINYATNENPPNFWNTSYPNDFGNNENHQGLPHMQYPSENQYQPSPFYGNVDFINYPSQTSISQDLPNQPMISGSAQFHKYPNTQMPFPTNPVPSSLDFIKYPSQISTSSDSQHPMFKGKVDLIKFPNQNQSLPGKYPLQQCKLPQEQSPKSFGGLWDMKYPNNENLILNNANISHNVPKYPVSNQITYQNPTNVGIRDVSYPNCTTMLPDEEDVNPKYKHAPGANLDVNVNFQTTNNEQPLDNVSNFKNNPVPPHYAPSKYNTHSDNQTPVKFGNIKDLAYSTYNPGDLNRENELRTSEQLPKRAPVNYNPNELNLKELNLNPSAVNVGIITDIEYPVIKEAIHKENALFQPEMPRKNIQFDSTEEEILPPCHKCKKMFGPEALVIGIDHTEALWHAECFKCKGCNQNLADLMYFYDKESNDVYCGRDYAKIRGIPRCQACDELIFVKEYCLAENSTFHVKHFCCFECDEPLAGKNYVMEETQPLCLPCFEKVKAEKCNACLNVIKPDEQGANLNGVHFHADDNCFACKVCKKPLLGAKFLFKNNILYCSANCFSTDK